MRKPLAVLLCAILGVVLYGVIDRRSSEQRAERERAEEALQHCWEVATANGGAGAGLCNALAEQLNK